MIANTAAAGKQVGSQSSRIKAVFGSLGAYVPGGMSAAKETPSASAKQEVSWRPFVYLWPLQCNAEL
jgi:hypothetical protein